MKKLVDQIRNISSAAYKPSRRFKFLVLLALVAALPIFVYAIMTQNFDIRNRAASGEPVPPATANPLNVGTPSVLLNSQDFFIEVNSKLYLARSNTWPLYISSDPGSNTYTTLELMWNENGVPMRLFIYFRADGNRWWAFEARTYNGQVNGDWITYFAGARYFESPLGTAYQGDVNLYGSDVYGNQGRISITNMRLLPFPGLKPTPSPTPQSPTPTPTTAPGTIIPSKTGCVKGPVYTGDTCTTGYRVVKSLTSSGECYNTVQDCLPFRGTAECVKSPTYTGDTCSGYRVMPGMGRSCYTLQQCQTALLPSPTPFPMTPAPTVNPTPTPAPRPWYCYIAPWLCGR